MGWDISLSDNEGVGFDEVRDRYEEDGETNEGSKKETGTEPKAETAELARDEIREKLREKNFLPTREQVKKAFSEDFELLMFCKGIDVSGGKDTYEADVEYSPIFEIWNKEYIEGLSNYMSKRLDALGATPENPVRIVEVGAGDGKLSAFLKEHMDDVADRVDIIATDSGEWDGIDQMQDVESYSAQEAVAEFKPDIVISSWMPFTTDFTKEFREQESVKEYILIGDSECTGAKWETWGWGCGLPKKTKEQFEERGVSKEDIPPPYKQDGFFKNTLEDLSEQQTCRTDYPSWDQWNHSRTVSFKREREDE